MINRERFYTQFKLHVAPRFTTSQYNGFEAIFSEWEAQDDSTDIRHLAYILATAWHETGTKMQAVEEIGKGRTRPYGRKIKMSGVAYKTPDKIYYGRGHVQLTWFENYQLMGRLLGIDLINKPELALDLKTSIKIMFEGMLRASSSFGDFTGKSLEHYFNAKVDDPIGARKIINGTDRARMIADYYEDFRKCL